ncbi:MAG: NADPH:quinone oxidoreductase family protein, partial [Alphaproteobacteria bacterium]|nr:NADPH:quinone oxidoreductase family protein [Alphaproteobacteria bacterium]
MRVILCPELGSPDVLTVEERPDPEPGMGEVLVRQEAWGVNYVDALMVAGGYQLKPDLPFVP